MDIAGLLDATLKAQGVPIIGVSIGSPSDQSTWVVHYDPSATPAQQVQGESIRAAFNANDPTVLAAQLNRDATAATTATIAKALCAVILDQKLGRALTTADVPAVQALFAKAVTYYKFAVNNGL